MSNANKIAYYIIEDIKRHLKDDGIDHRFLWRINNENMELNVPNHIYDKIYSETIMEMESILYKDSKSFGGNTGQNN